MVEMIERVVDILVSVLLYVLLMLFAILFLLMGVAAFGALTGAEWVKMPTKCANLIKPDGQTMPLGQIEYVEENQFRQVVKLKDSREFPMGQVVIMNCGR